MCCTCCKGAEICCKKLNFERVVRDRACANEIQIVHVYGQWNLRISQWVLYLWWCPGWLLVPRVSRCVRWRMAWQREVQGLTLERVARNLSVDVSTVHRIVKKFEETGSVNKNKCSVANRHQLQKLTKAVQLTVLHLILQRPCIYLWELQQEIYSMFGLEISVPSLCNFLKSNFSREKDAVGSPWNGSRS